MTTIGDLRAALQPRSPVLQHQRHPFGGVVELGTPLRSPRSGPEGALLVEAFLLGLIERFATVSRYLFLGMSDRDGNLWSSE
jgi:hypothetical protein